MTDRECWRGLLDHIAETKANVIEVIHQPRDVARAARQRRHRNGSRSPRQTTRTEVVEHLKESGYHVEREGVGDWRE